MSSTFFAQNLNVSATSTLGGDVVFDKATNDLTVTVADQASGAATATVPDLAGASQDFLLTTQTQNVSNKTIFDSSIQTNTEFVDPVDATKQVALDVSGALTGTATTLTFAQQANQTATFPNGSGTVAFQPSGSDNALIRMDTAGSFDTTQASTVTLSDTGDFAGVVSIAAPAATDLSLTTDAGQIVSVPGSAVIGGDLTVNGTTTSVNSENVTIADNNLLISSNYTTNVGRAGGIAVNYLPTTTTSNIVQFTAPLTVEVASGTGFGTAGDILLIEGAATPSNNGVFQIASLSTNTITLEVAPAHNFLQNAVTTDATAQGTATIVNVAVLQAGEADGRFEVATGSSATGMTFVDLALVSDIPAGGWIQNDTTNTSTSFSVVINTLPDADSATLEVVYTGRDQDSTGTIGGKLTRVFQKSVNVVNAVGAGSKDESGLGTGSDWTVTATQGATTSNIDINVTQAGAATYDWRVIYRLTVNPVV